MEINDDELYAMGDLAIGYAGYEVLRDLFVDPGNAATALLRVRDIVSHTRPPQIPSVELTELDDASDGYALWASSYDEVSNPFVELAQRELRSAIAAHSARALGAGLDAGTGTGVNLRLLREVCSVAVGVDRSEAMLAVAARADQESALVQADVRLLPFNGASFDLILCSLVLSHHRDIQPAISELSRVLRPMGRLLLVDLHPHAIMTGAHGLHIDEAGRIRVVRNFPHLVTDYMSAVARSHATLKDVREVCWPQSPYTSLGLLAGDRPLLSRPRIQASEPALIVVEAVRKH